MTEVPSKALEVALDAYKIAIDVPEPVRSREKAMTAALEAAAPYIVERIVSAAIKVRDEHADYLRECIRLRDAKLSKRDIVGLSATDAACYKWPAQNQAALRAAYVDGAQDYAGTYNDGIEAAAVAATELEEFEQDKRFAVAIRALKKVAA